MIFKYKERYEEAGGTPDAFDQGIDTPLAGWEFEVVGVGTYTTDANGKINLNVNTGSYTVKEVAPLPNHWSNTDPGDGTLQKDVTVDAGATVQVDFGNKYTPPIVPSLSQWGIIAMIAVFVGLLAFTARRKLASKTS